MSSHSAYSAASVPAEESLSHLTVPYSGGILGHDSDSVLTKMEMCKYTHAPSKHVNLVDTYTPNMFVHCTNESMTSVLIRMHIHTDVHICGHIKNTYAHSTNASYVYVQGLHTWAARAHTMSA